MASRSVSSLPKSAPRPGEFISGAYRVEYALGSGGMGYVLAVTRLSDRAKLAIKMLNPELSANPRVVARFLHEARAAQSITSEHVTRVFDVGTLPSGTPYLVMERLEGMDLGAWLAQEKKVPYAQAVDWTLEACEALAEAHAQRYVHRDLKPQNLFLHGRADAADEGRPFIKVLDFGIAKSLDTPLESKLTTTSNIVGSPAYMSPEQLRNAKEIDVHSDIWSLGVVMYELMAGVIPFDAATLPELSVLILTGKALPLTDRDADLPRELSHVVGACLRRDPSLRFGNLAELAVHLAPFGTAHGRASAERVIAQLGMPATRIVIGTEDELATTMEGPVHRASATSLPRDAADPRDAPDAPGARLPDVSAEIVPAVVAPDEKLTAPEGRNPFRAARDPKSRPRVPPAVVAAALAALVAGSTFAVHTLSEASAPAVSASATVDAGLPTDPATASALALAPPLQVGAADTGWSTPLSPSLTVDASPSASAAQKPPAPPRSAKKKPGLFSSPN